MPSRLFRSILFLVFLGVFPAMAKPVVTGYDLEASGGRTVFRLYSNEELDFKLFTLDNPTRLVIDIPDTAWRVAPAARGKDNVGVVTRVRNGWPKPGITRVVLDTASAVKVEDSYRDRRGARKALIVVLSVKEAKTESQGFLSGLVPELPEPTTRKPEPTTPTRQAWKSQHYEDKQAPPSNELLQPPATIRSLAPKRAVEPAIKQPDIVPPEVKSQLHDLRWAAIPTPKPKPEYYTIVIDPGHGGVDPGAISASGTREKEITYRYALQLKDTLERSGRYRVVLTRAGDTYISLRGRVKKAQLADSQLFISLHADSHPEPTMRGLSVYTLSEQASDKEAEALASRESKKDIISGVDLSENSQEVTEVLIDLIQRDTKNTSARFAELVVNEIGTEAKLLRNTHRFAGFAVLKGIGVPSVLVEMGYLSNPEEEKQLLSDDYRDRLVNAIARAVDTYCDQYVLKPDEE